MSHDKEELMLLALQRSLRHDGGTPSMFLDTLASAIDSRLWEKFGLTFIEMIIAEPPKGLGSSEDEIRQVIKLKHRYQDDDKAIRERMDWLKGEVDRLLVVPKNNHIGPQLDNTRNNVRHSARMSNTQQGYTSGEGSTNIKARLKRDNPDLAQKVFNQELSPHAAGIEAGFIKKRAKFVVGDVNQTAKQIRKYFDPTQIQELIRLLQDD